MDDFDLLPETSQTGEPPESDELTIESVLLHYGATKIPSGYGWKSMRCPFKQFHKDSRASAAVNHGTNKFRCHACGTAGDPIDIIRKLEGLSFKEAIGQAREIFGASVKTVSPSVPKRRKRRALGSERWKDILD